jgi:hypothetical protein
LFTLLGSASSYAEVGSETGAGTEADGTDHTALLASEVGIAAATVSGSGSDAIEKTLIAAGSKEVPPPAGGPWEILSIAAAGAGLLLVAGFLGLAAINSRKRPLRLGRAQPDRDW